MSFEQMTAEDWMGALTAHWRTSSASANTLAEFVNRHMENGALYTIESWNMLWNTQHPPFATDEEIERWNREHTIALTQMWSRGELTLDELFASLTALLSEASEHLGMVRGELPPTIRDRFDEWLREILRSDPQITLGGRPIAISNALLAALAAADNHPRRSEPITPPTTAHVGDFCFGSPCWPGTSKIIEEMGELQQVLGKLRVASHGDKTLGRRPAEEARRGNWGPDRRTPVLSTKKLHNRRGAPGLRQNRQEAGSLPGVGQESDQAMTTLNLR